MVYAPIYKDTYYSANSETLIYTISTDGVVIFSGKAYRMPNADILRININKICQDYLIQNLESILGGSSSQENSDACKDFVLKNAAGTTLETYRFLYCWDYGYTWSRSSVSNLSVPITGEYEPSMYKLKTQVSTGSTSVLNKVTTYANTGDYTKQECGDYALYYVNARGGWDSFLFTGRCRRVDSIKQFNFNRAFDNTTREFETGRYISEIEETYELNTGILTDAQATLFAKHLIGSNKCYLHSLKDGWIQPAVITDNQAEFKQYTGEDVITYALKIKLSQSKIRQ